MKLLIKNFSEANVETIVAHDIFLFYFPSIILFILNALSFLSKLFQSMNDHLLLKD